MCRCKAVYKCGRHFAPQVARGLVGRLALSQKPQLTELVPVASNAGDRISSGLLSSCRLQGPGADFRDDFFSIDGIRSRLRTMAAATKGPVGVGSWGSRADRDLFSWRPLHSSALAVQVPQR
jgi:hypothetical protein